MIAHLDFERLESNSLYARVRFACDVPGDDGPAIAKAGEIVRDKMVRWCRNWAGDSRCSFDTCPEFAQDGGHTTAIIHAVVPMKAVDACRAELSLG